ncbi:hypothetical protein [Candidatus Bandiella euplotis]|nr:hypothetical protein [Candidatus Bandiella woodruffii]
MTDFNVTSISANSTTYVNPILVDDVVLPPKKDDSVDTAEVSKLYNLPFVERFFKANQSYNELVAKVSRGESIEKKELSAIAGDQNFFDHLLLKAAFAHNANLGNLDVFLNAKQNNGGFAVFAKYGLYLLRELVGNFYSHFEHDHSAVDAVAVKACGVPKLIFPYWECCHKIDKMLK